MKKVLSVIVILGVLIIQFYMLDPRAISNKNTIAAERGNVDLTQWNFSKNGAINLNGVDWEFYDGQILSPEDFREESSKKTNLTGYVKLTSARRGYINGRHILPKGTGTYRITLKVNPSNKIYGMKAANIRMSNRLYVNDNIIGQSGNPEEKNNGYYPGKAPYSSYFYIQGDKAEIVLQTANFDYPFGGTIYEINFGLQKNIDYMTTLTHSIELACAILTFFFAFYHLSIYSIRKKDKIFLYYGIYYLILSISFFTNGEQMLIQIFPKISFEVNAKLQQISISLFVIILSAIIKEIDKKILPDIIIKIANIVSIPYIIITLATPYRIYSYLKLTMFIFIIIFIIIVILSLISICLRNAYGDLGKIGTYSFLGSMIFLFICLENNFLYIFNATNSRAIGMAAGIGFIVFSANAIAYSLVLTYEKMEKISEKLIKMDKVKDEFITKTSYELKAPLYGIINIAETIIKENSNYLNEKNKKDIVIIKNMALRLSNIIKDILDVTLLKDGQLKLNVGLVDIKPCTSIVIEASKYIIQNKNIEIISNIEESTIVKADEDRVRQILFNLINNSVQNMDKGIIKIGSYKAHNKVYITVEDNGSGIPMDKQEKIFKPYETLNSERIGLGLYLSRQLVELMNGEIYLVWSVINKGSRFIFTLPYSEEENKLYKVESIQQFNTLASVDYSETEQIKKHENTILIVDDEVFNIHTALNILSREGYNVLTASSGEEALNKIKDNKVDLVILDVIMQGISGIDVCRKIRENYSVIELPILITTLGNSDYDLFLGFEAGANDFITKPFEEKEIVARVKTLIVMKKSMEDAIKNELAFLQAQIKPHFLYNTLSTIISFCYIDGEKAAKLLTDFSKYLRLIFDIDNKLTTIPLRRELEMVEAYVEIEKARFGEKINIKYDIQEEIMDEEIPSLSIQPLVENAIKHGLCKKEQGGTVYVSVKKEKKIIHIVVRDTGVGMSEEKVKSLKNIDHKDTGIGFSNVSKRIRKLNKAEIDIYSIEGEGTTIRIYMEEL